MSASRAIATATLLLLLLCSATAAAHALAPLGLSIHQQDNGELSVRFKRALVQTRGARVAPSFPTGCQVLEQSDERTDDALITHYRVACSQPIAGSELSVSGLRSASVDAVVRIELQDGSVHRALLSASSPSYRVPHTVSRSSVVLSYGRLGIEHLLTGLDHVLFVLGLLWLVAERRRVIIALTSFTVGHSITLSAVSLGFVVLPTRLAEVAIAASLMVLAGAIVAKGQRRSDMRWLWPACAAVGLLHGLGFAGALADTGLPNADVPLALASFNIGIELAQVGVVLLAAGLAHALRGRLPSSELFRRQLPGYALGGIAAMWCIERALPALGL